MDTRSASQGPFYRRFAWTLLVGIGLLIALSTLAFFFIGIDPNDFAASTGMSLNEATAQVPQVVRYLERIERLVGVGYFGLGLIWTAVAFFFYRRGECWSWYLLWTMPLILGLSALVFFGYGRVGIGSYYAFFVLLCLLGLLLPRRIFFPRSEPIPAAA